jgi:hypothetical protein
MAVSKRLRYEIFRRDGHACKYCGARAPQVPLTIDHIVPKTLGGTDVPENLAAACFDCNAGKSSSLPDEGLVAAVATSANDWAADTSRPYREAVVEMFGSLPGFDDADARRDLARAFDVAHREDEDPLGEVVNYDHWPEEVKACVAVVERLAEQRWYSINAIADALKCIAGDRADHFLCRARQVYEQIGFDFTEEDLERGALLLLAEVLRDGVPS